MNTHSLLTGVFLLCWPALLLAQDKPTKPKSPAAAPDMAEGMKKWMESSTPGAGHKVLDAMVGEWDLTMKAWMAGPDAPPMESKGTASNKWILGGRYVQSDTTGVMMAMPMTGLGLSGYDSLKKKYTSFWIDTLSTSMLVSEGSVDTAGKAITFLGKMDEPMTGEKDKPVKMIHRFDSKDRQVFEMYDLAVGPNAKVFEIVYTRKK